MIRINSWLLMIDMLFLQSAAKEAAVPTRDRSHIDDTLRLAGSGPSTEFSGEEEEDE